MSNAASQKGLETNTQQICLGWTLEKKPPNYAQMRHLNEEAELRTCLQTHHDLLQLSNFSDGEQEEAEEQTDHPRQI